MSPPSIASQAAAVRHIHALVAKSGQAGEQTLEWASWAIRTLDWIAERPDLVKSLSLISDIFPGLTVEVRDVESD